MATCPFCQGQISEDLGRFGGPCPNCFNDIPGDEAATDPGVAARQAENVAQRIEAKKKGLRTVLTGGVVVLLLVGGGGWIAYEKHLEQQAIAALLAWEDTAATDFVFITTEQLEAMEAEVLALEAQAAEDEAMALELEERRQLLAQRRAEKALQDEQMAIFDDRWGEGAETLEGGTAPTKSTMGGPTSGVEGITGISIEDGGPTVEVVRKGEMMKGDAQIRKMVEQYVSRQGTAIQFCYQQAMNSHPGLGGAWHLSFRLNKDGTLSNVAFTPASSNGDTSFESCVVRRVERWQMNETSQPLDYRKKFTFKMGF